MNIFLKLNIRFTIEFASSNTVVNLVLLTSSADDVNKISLLLL